MESLPTVEIQTTEAISTKYDIVQALLTLIGCTIDELKKMNLKMVGILSVSSLRTGCDFEHISVYPFVFNVTLQGKTKTVYMAQLLDELVEEQYVSVTISSKSFNDRPNKVFKDAVSLTTNAEVNPFVSCNMMVGKSKTKGGYWLACGTIEATDTESDKRYYGLVERVANIGHKNVFCGYYHTMLLNKASEKLIIEAKRAAKLLKSLEQNTAEFEAMLKEIE